MTLRHHASSGFPMLIITELIGAIVILAGVLLAMMLVPPRHEEKPVLATGRAFLVSAVERLGSGPWRLALRELGLLAPVAPYSPAHGPLRDPEPSRD